MQKPFCRQMGVIMFSKGEYIICGSNGVCMIEDICSPPLAGVDKKRKYYALQPVYQKTCTVYTPVDNEKVIMRKILSHEEASDLINSVVTIEMIWDANDKVRESRYREAIRTFECNELIRIIKSLYIRKDERFAEGKKSLTTDDKYLHQAEELLYGEIAVALSMTKEAVCQCILERVRPLATAMAK